MAEYRLYIDIDLSKYEKMYDKFDDGHNNEHMERVRNTAVLLARVHAPEQTDLAWIAATLHDVGLSQGRDDHEKNGANMVARDRYLQSKLGGDHSLVVDAIREHRASNGRPTTNLGKIISDADRCATTTSYAVYRAVSYAMRDNPARTLEECFDVALEHHIEKYGPGAYGRRVYFPETAKIMDAAFDPILRCRSGKELKKLLSAQDMAKIVRAYAAIERSELVPA